MSQFQNQSQVPQKFTDAQGNVNVAALAQGVEHLGGNAIEHQLGDGTFNIEGLAAAYTTLESTRNQKVAPVVNQVTTQVDLSTAPKLNIEEASSPAQIDWDKMSREVQQYGTLQPATRQNLISAGMSEAIIDQHVAGVKAVAENNIRKMADTIGGMENYENFVVWSNANMSIEDRQALVSSMNQPGGHLALAGAFAQYQNAGGLLGAQGGEPNDINTLTAGGGRNVQGVSPFQSKLERFSAFKDLRYGRDPEYTAQVWERVRATHAAVQQLKAQPAQ